MKRDTVVVEKNLVRVGGVSGNVIFTEELLRAIGKANRHQCLHYNEDTKFLVWRGILWGEVLSPQQNHVVIGE